MRFEVGDRVVSTELPPYVDEEDHPGNTGVILRVVGTHRLSAYGPCPYLVHFDYMIHDDTDGWWCQEHGLEPEKPLPSIEEALTGLREMLTS